MSGANTDSSGNTRANSAQIARRVAELAAPVAERLGYVIWDCRFRFEEGSWCLQIEIDLPRQIKTDLPRQDEADLPDGITLNDCEAFSRAIDPVLDAADPIEQSYSLEVSSPGLERELRTPEQISAMLGSQVEIKLRVAADAGAGPTKSLHGTLAAFDGTVVQITGGGETRGVPLENIKKIKTVFEM